MYVGIGLRERAWIEPVVSVLEYLWVAGLAFVVLNTALCLPGKDVVSDITLYLCMGSVFPIAALLVCLGERYARLSRFTMGLKVFFVLFALYQFYEYWFGEDSFLTFLVFPFLCALIILPYWYSQADREILPKRWATAFLLFVVSLVCWIAAQHLVINEGSFWEWAVKSWRVVPVLILATGLTAAALFRQGGACSGKKWRWAGHFVALCLFAGLCFQTDSLHGYRVYSICGFEHHWAFWIGPVESVRDGGWLLWDVPSQYGFLNILAIAALPISDAWEALYVLQSLLLFIVAVMVYGLINRWGSRLHNYLFSVLFTVATVFLLPGLLPQVLSGVHPWPNVGPLRYFWLFVSIVVLWLFLGRKSPNIYRYLWVGSFCWVMGILWSCESGAFCSTVFISALCVLIFQQAVETFQAKHSWSATLRICWPFVVIPAGMLSFAVVLIWVYYMVYLGKGPDWLGYCEYALMHVGNESLTSSPVPMLTRAEALIAVACIFATIAIWKYRVHPLSPQVAVALGSWFAFWDSLLLFVTLKHLPFSDSGTVFAMVLGIFIPLLDGIARPLLTQLVRYALLPIIVFLLTITYAHPDSGRVFKSLQLPEEHLARTMCPMEPSACLLLDYAGLGPEASLVCDYQGRLLPPPRHQKRQEGTWASSHSWLPKPLVMLAVLPISRQDLYCERWVNRFPDGGWLLVERPKRFRLDRIRHPYLPKLIVQLMRLPVSHWNAELYSTVFRCSTWREVTRQSTVCKGRLFLKKVSNYCTIQKIVENEHWSLYRCVPRTQVLPENHGALNTRG